MFLNQIKEDLKEAQKAGIKEQVSVLRLVLASIVNKQKDKFNEELNDEEIVEVIKQEAKKIKDAIEGFEKGGRLEQAEEERKQLSFIEKYLPEQMSEEEVRKIVTEVIEENKIEDMKGIGVVMKEVMAKTKGEADGKLINQIAREILQ